MLISVAKKIETDVAHIYESIKGSKPVLTNEYILDSYYDVGDGSGTLLDEIIQAFNDKNFSKLITGSCLIYQPFHLSKALLDGNWHKDFDLKWECLRNELPILYNDRIRRPTPTKQTLINEAHGERIDLIKRFVDAYKYGNGFSVIRHEALPMMHNSMANFALHMCLHV